MGNGSIEILESLPDPKKRPRLTQEAKKKSPAEGKAKWPTFFWDQVLNLDAAAAGGLEMVEVVWIVVLDDGGHN